MANNPAFTAWPVGLDMVGKLVDGSSEKYQIIMSLQKLRYEKLHGALLMGPMIKQVEHSRH